MSPAVPRTLTRLAALADELGALVAGFDPTLLLASEALDAVSSFSRLHHLASAGETLAAGAVAERQAWKPSGEPSCAHWLSRATGVGLGEARDVLAAAHRLGDQPAVEAAVRSGVLSRAQVHAITDAVAVNPNAADGLLGAVGTESMSEFRDRCLTEKVKGYPDPEANHRDLHKNRSLRTRTTADGAFRLSWKVTAEMGAAFMAALTPFQEALFHQARKAGTREPSEALAADALAAMGQASLTGAGPSTEPPADAVNDDDDVDAHGRPDQTDPGGDGATPDDVDADPRAVGLPNAAAPTHKRRRPQRPQRKGPPTKIIVRVDLPTLLRGHPIDGEVCEIAGYGPIPVSVLRDMLPDAALAVVFTKGQDVLHVTHLSRRARAHQITALEWAQPRCAVQGCNRRARLQIDHRLDWVKTRHTTLSELDRLCDHHHALKTRHHWQLVPGSGDRPMVPPGHPHHPDRDTTPTRSRHGDLAPPHGPHATSNSPAHQPDQPPDSERDRPLATAGT